MQSFHNHYSISTSETELRRASLFHNNASGSFLQQGAPSASFAVHIIHMLIQTAVGKYLIKKEKPRRWRPAAVLLTPGRVGPHQAIKAGPANVNNHTDYTFIMRLCVCLCFESPPGGLFQL